MNYKKCIGLCLAILLLVSNIGLAFNVHYCGGKIATVSVRAHDNIISSEKSCCAKKVIDKDSCCKNKTVLKAYSFAPYIAYLVPEIKKEIVATHATFISQAISTYYFDAHAPPLFKLYHQFIFYA
jgi:hypothetical protein